MLIRLAHANPSASARRVLVTKMLSGLKRPFLVRFMMKINPPYPAPIRIYLQKERAVIFKLIRSLLAPRANNWITADSAIAQRLNEGIDPKRPQIQPIELEETRDGKRDLSGPAYTRLEKILEDTKDFPQKVVAKVLASLEILAPPTSDEMDEALDAAERAREEARRQSGETHHRAIQFAYPCLYVHTHYGDLSAGHQQITAVPIVPNSIVEVKYDRLGGCTMRTNISGNEDDDQA